jgi:primosomal protein N' (replication factor Y)
MSAAGRQLLASKYFTSQVTKVVAELAKSRADFAWPDDVTQMLDVDPMHMT